MVGVAKGFQVLLVGPFQFLERLKCDIPIPCRHHGAQPLFDLVNPRDLDFRLGLVIEPAKGNLLGRRRRESGVHHHDDMRESGATGARDCSRLRHGPNGIVGALGQRLST